MKYRFRPSGKKRAFLIPIGAKLRAKGRDKPKRIRNLPEAREKIDFSEIRKRGGFYTLLFSAKRSLLRLGLWIKAIFKKAWAKLKSLSKKAKTAAANTFEKIPKRKRRKKSGSAASLPLLAGAMTASFLVCAFSLIYMAFGLFSFYGRSYRSVTVPNTVGMLYSEIGDLGDDFLISVVSVNNPSFPDGTVISQSPPAGVERRIYKDTGPCKITLTVSKSVLRSVPKGILGMSERDAALSLKNAGFSYTVNKVYSDAAYGSVISVSPKSGTVLSNGESVTLTVSLGKRVDTVFMPDLTGLSESEATDQLKMLGLNLRAVVYIESNQKAGTVTAQSIIKGASVSKGTEVSLSVSLGR